MQDELIKELKNEIATIKSNQDSLFSTLSNISKSVNELNTTTLRLNSNSEKIDRGLYGDSINKTDGLIEQFRKQKEEVNEMLLYVRNRKLITNFVWGLIKVLGALGATILTLYGVGEIFSNVP